MKVILEIPDEEVEIIKRNGFNKDGTFSFKLNEVVKQAIRNGVVIPDNATNGDVIMAIFKEIQYYSDGHIDAGWWNEPYENYKKENVE